MINGVFHRLRAILGMSRCEAFVRSLATEAETRRFADQWNGTMRCRYCFHAVKAFRSSGMSEAFPHFYCNQCSNAIHRDTDNSLVYYVASSELSMDLVNTIAATLPDCPCGGRFTPGANPKCPICCTEFKHQNDVVKRLTDYHVIVINGACLFSDNGLSFRIQM